MRRPQVTIVGNKSGGSRWSDEVAGMAFDAGALAAKLGFVVVSGGRSGVMEAACEGAKTAGGTTVGILPCESLTEANPWCDIVIPTNLGIGRNVLTALACDCMVALPGGQGTNQEISFALSYAKPIFSWDSWCYEGADVRRAEFAFNGDRSDIKPLAEFLARNYELAMRRINLQASQ